MNLFKTTVNAAGAVVAVVMIAGAASAASVTFDTWTDTDSPSTDPLIVISEIGTNSFEVDVSLGIGSLVGSIITLYFDVGTNYAAMDVDDCCYVPSSASSTSGVIDPGSVSSFGQIGSNVYTGFDFALEFDKKDGVGGDTSVSFKLDDGNGILALEDFYAMGVRVQEVGPQGASDKLFGYVSLTPVPLPAAGWLLLAGVGGLAAMRRRNKA